MKLMTNCISLNSTIKIESIVNSCNIYIFKFFEADSIYSKNYELSKLFVDFKSLDVNFIPINDYDSIYTKINNKIFVLSSLMKAIRNKDDEFIIKSQLIDSFIIAFYSNSVSAFLKLIELFIKTYHDINAPAFNGNSLLVEAIIQKARVNIISLILNYPNFDSKKSDIIKAFVLCCSK